MNDYTVGIEEEYQLVDPETSELRSSGRAVIASDWSGEIRKELQESTIEVGTRVSAGSAAALRDVRRLRAQAAAAAAAEELSIVAAGVHPFSGWRGHRMAAGERYAQMAELYGRIARDEHNYGMHVHVAPAAGSDRMRLVNAIRWYIPHLLALSCSSPFFEGEDTGYASWRMVLWRRWPGAVLPPRLGSEAEYRRYVEYQLRAGVLVDERSIYWMIRPHPEYPTLEFRMCDVCPSLEDAAAIAGLARVLVAAAAEGALPVRRPDELGWNAWDALAADDFWRAARYGLDAQLVDPRAGSGGRTARASIAALLDDVAAVAGELDELTALQGVARILERGNGAERMRRAHEECDDLRLVTEWLAAETLVGAGMDRRSAQREQVEC
jgi:glutamate---cysteine ligase / carboxylate-amine ligase